MSVGKACEFWSWGRGKIYQGGKKSLKDFRVCRAVIGCGGDVVSGSHDAVEVPSYYQGVRLKWW